MCDINWPKIIKKTKIRTYILDLLYQQAEPISANDLFFKLQQEGHTVSLSTVYRALETFVHSELVIRLTIGKSLTALYQINRRQHTHYAVCLTCKNLTPLSICPLEVISTSFIQNVTQEQGESFQVTGHNLELFGYCANCQTHAMH